MSLRLRLSPSCTRLVVAAVVSAVLTWPQPLTAAEVAQEPFGKTADGTAVQRFRLTGDGGLVVEVISYGATVRSILAADAAGRSVDVVNGFDDVAGYQSDDNQYFGCTTGRVCNRIAGARFELDDQTYRLAANDGENTLHGGVERSLDKVVWQGEPDLADPSVAAVDFTYFSPDGEEGFPGNVHFKVRFAVTSDNSLVIRYSATTDLTTPINLTNHSYFNLGGHGNGTILDHELSIMADAYTPTDDRLIPTGEIETVVDTPLDFRSPRRIGDRIEELTDTAALGYDHNFVLRHPQSGVRLVARLRDPASGRTLSVLSDQPGLQFYSGNFLAGQTGKQGKAYVHRGALCLEAQAFPDSVNQPNFPPIWLQPGGEYAQTTIYRFGHDD